MKDKKDIALSAIAVGGLSIVGILGCSAIEGTPMENLMLPVVCGAVLFGTACILIKSK